MNNLLIPTDFSTQSLSIVHAVVNMQPQQPVRIYLAHLLHIPVDIMDLMFLKTYRGQQQVPDAFDQEVQLLRDQYPDRIASIGLEFYYGNRVSVLEGMISNRQIDAICVLNNYTYGLPLKDSVDMMPLIDRCNVPVHRIPPHGKTLMAGAPGKASATFFRKDLTTAM